MNTYFAYTRVSTAKQGERGSSLHEQKSAIEAYGVRHGLTIVEWFEDRETAAKLGRRMFNRMMTELEKGRAQGVIIHKIDRSARNLKDWAHLGELIDRGVEVHFAHESLDLHSRGGRLSADIQAVVAADYIRNLREEVRKGFYGRLKQGLYPLPAPRGYSDSGKGKPKLIDPVEGPLVRLAFEKYASGAYTLHTLREELFQLGLAGRSGRKLSLCALATLLHNPFYIGVIRIERTGEVFEGVHEPLITKALFVRVQDVMSGRAYAREQKHRFAFRRMIRCAACGYALIGEHQKGHTYYRCHSTGCRGTSLKEAAVSETLAAIFEVIALDNADLRDMRDLITRASCEEARSAEQRRAHLQSQLQQVEDRQTRLTDAFIDNLIDKETFEGRKTGLIVEKRGLLDRLGEPKEDTRSSMLLKNLELGNMALQQLYSPESEEKRLAVQKVTSNLLAKGKNLCVRLQFPFDEIAKIRLDQIGAPPCVARRNDGVWVTGNEP